MPSDSPFRILKRSAFEVSKPDLKGESLPNGKNGNLPLFLTNIKVKFLI